MDLTRQQAEILQRLYGQGFEIAVFPMYASYVGVRKTCLGFQTSAVRRTRLWLA